MGAFLVVETFPAIYRHMVDRYSLTRDFYAIPRIDRQLQQCAIQFRGLDRDPLTVDLWQDDLAGIRVLELEEMRRADHMRLFDLEAVHDALSWLDQPGDYEVVWARTVDDDDASPPGFQSAGFEPSWFPAGWFSASCDCMLIPRWHGTDEEGTLFLDHFRRLNRHGLFTSPSDAAAFLAFYESFDWTEEGDYNIVEVFLVPGPIIGTANVAHATETNTGRSRVHLGFTVSAKRCLSNGVSETTTDNVLR